MTNRTKKKGQQTVSAHPAVKCKNSSGFTMFVKAHLTESRCVRTKLYVSVALAGCNVNQNLMSLTEWLHQLR